MQPILLASSSPYRRELLTKLALPFQWARPDVDETLRLNESAEDLVCRLSLKKAQALSDTYPDHLIIGSDQAAVLDDKILGKPLNFDRAFKQLRAASGRSAIFKTGLCLLDAASGRYQIATEQFQVHFRELSDAQIRHYLNYEQPYDCAGSFKCEGLGIALFEKLIGDDPNTLIGLPLIRLTNMLRSHGIDPLTMDKNFKI